jgi:hypothetical protein
LNAASAFRNGYFFLVRCDIPFILHTAQSKLSDVTSEPQYGQVPEWLIVSSAPQFGQAFLTVPAD